MDGFGDILEFVGVFFFGVRGHVLNLELLKGIMKNF